MLLLLIIIRIKPKAPMERKPQEYLEDSYDEAKLSTLKKEIALPKSELFELVNDDGKCQ
jgi:hypothetical protein